MEINMKIPVLKFLMILHYKQKSFLIKFIANNIINANR